MTERIVGLLKARGCTAARRVDSKPVSVWWESEVDVPAFQKMKESLATG